MRCSCRVCGAYMVQRERGILSGCVCPECLSTCSMCTMTDGGTPKSPEELAMRFSMLTPAVSAEEEDPLTAPISPAEYED